MDRSAWAGVAPRACAVLRCAGPEPKFRTALQRMPGVHVPAREEARPGCAVLRRRAAGFPPLLRSVRAIRSHSHACLPKRRSQPNGKRAFPRFAHLSTSVPQNHAPAAAVPTPMPKVQCTAPAFRHIRPAQASDQHHPHAAHPPAPPSARALKANGNLAIASAASPHLPARTPYKTY